MGGTDGKAFAAHRTVEGFVEFRLDLHRADVDATPARLEAFRGISLQGEDRFRPDEPQQPAGRADVTAGELLAEDQVEQREQDDASERDREGAVGDSMKEGLTDRQIG